MACRGVHTILCSGVRIVGSFLFRYVWAPRGAVSAAGLHSGLKKHPPPSSYICHRCGNTGHWIQLCPTNGVNPFIISGYVVHGVYIINICRIRLTTSIATKDQ